MYNRFYSSHSEGHVFPPHPAPHRKLNMLLVLHKKLLFSIFPGEKECNIHARILHWLGRASMIFCGPSGCGPETCRPAGPGLVNNNFVGGGPGLGLTSPGLGRPGPTVKVTLVLT